VIVQRVGNDWWAYTGHVMLEWESGLLSLCRVFYQPQSGWMARKSFIFRLDRL
jgi:hypothetical protein